MSSMTNASAPTIRDLLSRAGVMPVVVIEDPERAVALAGALERGGMTAIEITLRTPAALEAASRIIGACPGLTVGLGTVTSAAQLVEARALGAAFAVSPGLHPRLVETARALGLPYLPGVCTASEIMQAMALGLDTLKFFPAAAAGGPGMLRQFANLFPGLRFCPTGGVNSDNLPDYLALPNVACAGGSWIAPASLIAASDWAGIEQLARASLRHRR
jgi:2-dehydro-3-deoxyphosphogluconate aldolase/(4S)-4-hydroxy-2-oxoglutarate aldolase